MTAPHKLPWDPLTPPEVVALFAGWDRFWCIAGGWALDLYAGKVSREHEDVDVLVLRRDLDAVHRQLPGWELWVAWPPGTLIPWRPGEQIHAKAHDIWSRPVGTERWQFQIMVMDHDENNWIFRRDWSTGGPMESLSRVVDGVPVIAPEIQLLFKGNGTRRPKDEADFRTILPHLTGDQIRWLHHALASREPNHPWLRKIASREREKPSQ